MTWVGEGSKIEESGEFKEWPSSIKGEGEESTRGTRDETRSNAKDVGAKGVGGDGELGWKVVI